MRCTRRRFLRASLGASTLLSIGRGGALVPSFLRRSALAAAEPSARGENVLVVVQLTGGNDGLNTVIPFDDDAYGRGRPTLRIPGKKVHRIDSRLGFHPQLGAFSRLLENGHLGIVQGVGYPSSSRDHGAAMTDWQTARPGEPDCQTGWLGRAIDQVGRTARTDVPGVFVGGIEQPFGLRARRAIVPSIRAASEWTLDADAETRGELRRLAGLPRKTARDPLLEMLRASTVEVCAGDERVEAAIAKGSREKVSYPSFPLARSLRDVAKLMRADLGVRIYFTELGGGGIGGFDSHANQADNHGALLRELSESVSAFVADLQHDKLLDRTLLVTISEFGRTVAENGRRGTGHGVAAPLFLAGGRVRGGLIGEHPSLTDLDGDAMKHHTDFRSVYGTILDEWLGVDGTAVLGDSFPRVAMLG